MKSRFVGKGIKYDAYTDEVTFKLSFLNVDRMQFLEDLIKSDKEIVLEIVEKFRRDKTYPQLKRYHAMLKSILLAKKVRPTPRRIKGLDTFIKENLIECDRMDFEEGIDDLGNPIVNSIILPPSKANMTIEELNDLMNLIEDKFSYLNIDWQTGEVVNV